MLTYEYIHRINEAKNSEKHSAAYKTQGKFNRSELKRVNNKYCSHFRMKNHSNKECWFLKQNKTKRTIILTHITDKTKTKIIL